MTNKAKVRMATYDGCVPQQQVCSRHGFHLGEGCPVCQAEDPLIEEPLVIPRLVDRAELEAAEAVAETLRDALRALAHGAVSSILSGYPRKVHPGRPCIDIPFIAEDVYMRAIEDLKAARAALSESGGHA